MSNPLEKPAIGLNAGSAPAKAVTVVPSHEEEETVRILSVTVGRYEQIRRRLAQGRAVREIARALGCARASAARGTAQSRVGPNGVPSLLAPDGWRLEAAR